MVYPILSSQQLREINQAIQDEKDYIELSFDLNYSGKKEKVMLFEKGIILKENKIEIPEIKVKDKSCYLILEDTLERTQYFSGNGIYKLIPTSFRPILQISGTSMHKQAFVERIESEKLQGKVLDSGTGLGYTAIAASETAKKVVTIEFDKMVCDIQKINPYSQKLFINEKIKLIQGDLTQAIRNFQEKEFDSIVLDGGTPKSSGHFFSLENYQQVFRILKNNSKLYHYVPNPHIHRGKDFAERIMRLLKKAGFSVLERNKEGSYLIAEK